MYVFRGRTKYIYRRVLSTLSLYILIFSGALHLWRRGISWNCPASNLSDRQHTGWLEVATASSPTHRTEPNRTLTRSAADFFIANFLRWGQKSYSLRKPIPKQKRGIWNDQHHYPIFWPPNNFVVCFCPRLSLKIPRRRRSHVLLLKNIYILVSKKKNEQSKIF